MKYFLSLIFICLMSVSAQARDYYFCSTATDDSGTGLIDDPYKTISKFGTVANAMSAGESIFFCRGGEWEPTSTEYINPICTAENRCIVDAYGTGKKPWIKLDSVGLLFGTNNTVKYMTWRNLKFGSTTYQTSTPNPNGAFVYYGGTNEGNIWEYNEFSYMRDAIVFGNPQDSSGTYHLDATIRYNTFTDISVVGHLVGGNGMKIYGNTYVRVGATGGRPMYNMGTRGATFTTDLTQGQNYYISGNDITSSVQKDIGNGDYLGTYVEGDYGCGGNNLGGHGSMDGNIYVNNNILREFKGVATGGCWGINFDEGWGIATVHFGGVARGDTGILRIADNETYWLGNLSYGCNACSGSEFIGNTAYSFLASMGIDPTNKNEAGLTYPTESSTAKYNFFVFDTDTTTNTGLNFRPDAGGTATVLTSVLEYNIIVFGNDDTGNKCIDADIEGTKANNFCFAVDSSGNIVNHTVNNIN